MYDQVYEHETITARVRSETEARLAALLPEAGASDGDREGASPEPSPLRASLLAAVSTLERGLVERGTEARLLILAACCGEHLLLVGPPGTAKSEVARRLGGALLGSAGGASPRFFQRILTRFSVPEELFGPLSLAALERDEYVRQTRGYLPEAEVAFIDEIFKANSAILNALLTLLNEVSLPPSAPPTPPTTWTPLRASTPHLSLPF